MSPMKIVIAQEELPLALGLVEIVRTSGHEVVAIAANEAEALAAAECHRPDLLLTDVSLGGRADGPRIAATVWSHWGIPTLLLCQAIDASLLGRFSEDGVIGFMPRPIGTAIRGLTMIEVQNALSGDRCRVLPGPALTLGDFLATQAFRAHARAKVALREVGPRHGMAAYATPHHAAGGM
ncbi:response regulator [Arenibaculum pallidiluteum]|uniref:response regulator n=1 Tax=Arenibaculum pallidiluteum TaxID=2812559 RepID=UPI001A9572C8|nr:response regulator [Arenibaculum pallidiluteum]